jgi:hypothetical protein
MITATACITPDVPTSVARIVQALCARAGITVVPLHETHSNTVHITMQPHPENTPHVRVGNPAVTLQHFLEILRAGRTTSIPLAEGWALHQTIRELQHTNYPAIALTEREAALLLFLLQHNGQEISRETLMQHVWAYDASVSSHTLETHIYRLRHKLEDSLPPPCHIHTTEHGYRLTL